MRTWRKGSSTMDHSRNRSAAADFFNVFQAQYEVMETDYFLGSGADARILFESADRHHLVVATRYPQGVRFRYGATVDYQEAFFVVRGEGSRSFPDGNVVAMTAGDLIYVRPGVDVEYVYSPGFLDVAFFWSVDKPLDPSLAAGVARRGLSG